MYYGRDGNSWLMENISNMSHILFIIIDNLAVVPQQESCFQRQGSSIQILWRTYMVATEVQLVTPKVQSVCSSLMLHFLPIKQKRTKIGKSHLK